MAATAVAAAAGATNGSTPLRRKRFADIPASIDIPVSAGDDDEDDETAVVEVDPDSLPDDPTELCTLLENEGSPRRFWMHIALSYAKHSKVDMAIEIISKGIQVLTAANADKTEKLPMLNCLTWLCLQRSREAPKGAGADAIGYSGETRTKDHYLQMATQTLNESMRLDPQSSLNTLARGLFGLFKSSVSSQTERNHQLDAAGKAFEEAVRLSRGQNMMAVLGKARVLYGKKRFDKALECYQEVLQKRPDMDPDPRIGIGMCFWSLGHKEDARNAWERALQVDPESKVAHILLAQYYLHLTSSLSEYDTNFAEHYKSVIRHTQLAYKLDNNFPMACTTFSSHFFSRKGYEQSEKLAKKAIDFTDVPAITSDGYYLQGRKLHAEGELEEALKAYRKSEQFREGGYLPGAVGSGQVQVLLKDIPSAKLTFEKIVSEHPKCIEAKTILGTLYAHEVLSGIPRTGFSASKEDVTGLHRKAIALLEAVRNAWKGDKQSESANESLLLTLARLYENEQPDKALGCLQAVEQIYKDLREDNDEIMIPLQLLNNMAVFYWHQSKYDLARELYQQALNAIPELKRQDDTADTDALATTLTYNLARCEEAAGNTDEAKKQYEQLLTYHEDYVDANVRLAHMALRRGEKDGPERMRKLMETDGNNLEVRALNGYFLSKQKKKPVMNIAEDPEQRHYKHSLQHYDKHDRYSLTAMGSLYLMSAREMRRDTESDKEKRRKAYEKAVEFFDKALQLDPRNAYAAQGIAIALVEDKKDLRGAVSIFTKVRETLSGDSHAIVNLAHCLAGLEQWGRAIENYDIALRKYGSGRDPILLSCLGRVWYAKGKKEAKLEPEKSYESLQKSLGYAKRALELCKEQPIYMFNVAFVQSEMVVQLLNLREQARNVANMEIAAKEIDEAVKTFWAVAASRQPPYPRKDIEARAKMHATTSKKLDRHITSQREYESANAAKLAEARKRREEEMRRRQEEMDRVAQAEEKRKREIAEQRKKMQEEARAYAERKEREEREREMLAEEMNERKKRRKKDSGGGTGRRSKKDRDRERVATSDLESDEGPDDEGPRTKRRSTVSGDDESTSRPPKRRKKLERANTNPKSSKSATASASKYKSSERVADSDNSDDLSSVPDDDDAAQNLSKSFATIGAETGSALPAAAGSDDENGGAAAAATGAGRKKRRAVVSDDEDDDDLFGDTAAEASTGDEPKPDEDLPMADDDATPATTATAEPKAEAEADAEPKVDDVAAATAAPPPTSTTAEPDEKLDEKPDVEMEDRPPTPGGEA